MWNNEVVNHKGACCMTWLSWIVALLYAGACAFIVGYVATNGLFTSDAPQSSTAGNNNNTTTNTTSANGTAATMLADMAAQITTCKIKETSDFAAEWAILIATSLGTWAIATRPASITFVFCVSRLQSKYCPGKESVKGAGEWGAPRKAQDGMGVIAEEKTANDGDSGMVEMSARGGNGRGDDLDRISVQYDNPMRRKKTNGGGGGKGDGGGDGALAVAVGPDAAETGDLEDSVDGSAEGSVDISMVSMNSMENSSESSEYSP